MKQSSPNTRHTTIEEYEAEAMLMGMDYMAIDHTYNEYGRSHSGFPVIKRTFDADTLEELPNTVEIVNKRARLVAGGKIGLGPKPPEAERNLTFEGNEHEGNEHEGNEHEGNEPSND